MTELNREELRKLKLVRVQGQLVERDALRIAEKITNYDPNLYLQVLAEDDVSVDQPPFRVMEICKDGIHRVAMTAWQLDDRIIQRLYAADTAHHNVLDELDARNEKQRAIDRRRYQEKREAAHDLSWHVLRSPKNTYTARHPETGEKLTFK